MLFGYECVVWATELIRVVLVVNWLPRVGFCCFVGVGCLLFCRCVDVVVVEVGFDGLCVWFDSSSSFFGFVAGVQML